MGVCQWMAPPPVALVSWGDEVRMWNSAMLNRTTEWSMPTGHGEGCANGWHYPSGDCLMKRAKDVEFSDAE